jgi:hypothetical protein
MIATLVVLHGGDGHIDLVYFWSAVVMAGIPVGVFVVIGFLAVRAYFRRREADGGGEVEPHARLPQ